MVSQTKHKRLKRYFVTFVPLCVLIVSLTASAAQKPAAAPLRWKPLIGEYTLADQTLIILERDGKLCALFNRTDLSPLQEISKDKFQFEQTSARAADRVLFSRDPRGRVTDVKIGELGIQASATRTRSRFESTSS